MPNEKPQILKELVLHSQILVSTELKFKNSKSKFEDLLLKLNKETMKSKF